MIDYAGEDSYVGLRQSKGTPWAGSRDLGPGGQRPLSRRHVGRDLATRWGSECWRTPRATIIYCGGLYYDSYPNARL